MVNTYVIIDKNRYGVIEILNNVYRCAKIVGFCLRKDKMVTVRKDSVQLFIDNTIPCGKIRLAKSEADAQLEEISKGNQPESRKEVRSYFCKRCNAYHLTSKSYVLYTKEN